MKEKQITDQNLFMKLVVTGLIRHKTLSKHPLRAVDLILDYKWEVFESEEKPHTYRVTGYHPVAKRIDMILENTVVH